MNAPRQADEQDKETLWECMQERLDESDLWMWMASKWRTLDGDLEDSLVRAAATHVGADLLATYNKEMLSQSVVPMVTSEDAIA